MIIYTSARKNRQTNRKSLLLLRIGCKKTWILCKLENDQAPLALMRMVTDGPDHPSTPALRMIEDYIKELDIPAEIVWGMKDPILAKTLPMMKNNFPNAPVIETSAGHFLQEEVPVEIAEALIRVIDQVSSD